MRAFLLALLCWLLSFFGCQPDTTQPGHFELCPHVVVESPEIIPPLPEFGSE